MGASSIDLDQEASEYRCYGFPPQRRPQLSCLIGRTRRRLLGMTMPQDDAILLDEVMRQLGYAVEVTENALLFKVGR